MSTRPVNLNPEDIPTEYDMPFNISFWATGFSAILALLFALNYMNLIWSEESNLLNDLAGYLFLFFTFLTIGLSEVCSNLGEKIKKMQRGI